MFENFDTNLFDNPEFKEDAVREELLAPLLHALGYSPSGDNKIVRSRRLSHPFVMIGSSRNKISRVLT